MPSTAPHDQPDPPSSGVRAIARRLENAGFRTGWHGEGLLLGLRSRIAPTATQSPARGAHALTTPTILLCEGASEAILEALPHAVVTAAAGRRITTGSRGADHSDAIDIVPLGPRSIEDVLPDFGLSPFGFAWRLADSSWIDPNDLRTRFIAGELDVIPSSHDTSAFVREPARYWIAARLLSEWKLRPIEALVDVAGASLRDALPSLPVAAVARREIQRVIASNHPTPGLQFLEDTGVTRTLFPGMRSDAAELVGRLPGNLPVRWAAWLRGTATGRAIRELRVPHDLAREIEFVLRQHPIEGRPDAASASGLEARLRRLRQRLSQSEIADLIAWRRAELDLRGADDAARRKLSAAETKLGSLVERDQGTAGIRALALDGASVMRVLDCGPGRRVGQALSHLSQLVRADATKNDADALTTALRAWAATEGST